MSVPVFGLVAGVLQAAGYLFYYILVVRKAGKQAEPLTWFMFAYGTALLTVMELDSMWKAAAADNSWINMLSVLLLPLVCSIGGIGVAVAIWRENYLTTNKWWPRRWRIDWNNTDGRAFVTDLFLTILYVCLWAISIIRDTSDHAHLWWVIAFLTVSNLTIFPGFVPILRATSANPELEDWRPWLLWTLAYGILMLPTWVYATNDVVWPTEMSPLNWDISVFLLISLMSYPVINTVMHGAMVVVSLKDSRHVSAEN